MPELERAKIEFANIYYGAVVGCDWEEACSVAQTVADNAYRESGGNERAAASRVCCEAERYADM